MDASRDIVTKTYQGILFKDLYERLIEAIKSRNYQIERISNIDNILGHPEDLEKGIHIGFQHYKIIEFCNLQNCARMLASNLQAGVFMPVRFIIYQLSNQNQIKIVFLKPKALAKLFSSPSLARFADILEKDMNHVLEAIDF